MKSSGFIFLQGETMLSFEYNNGKEKFKNAITRQGEKEGFIVTKDNDAKPTEEYNYCFSSICNCSFCYRVYDLEDQKFKEKNNRIP